ncbi:MAG: hypothetical protein R3C39_00400 [Dehalococcoidia bacterium]
MAFDRVALLAVLDPPIARLAGEELRDGGFIVIETSARTLGGLAAAAHGRMIDVAVVDVALDMTPGSIRRAFAVHSPVTVLSVACSLTTAIEVAREDDVDGILVLKPWAPGALLEAAWLGINDGNGSLLD